MLKKKMKKIAILTITDGENYGNRLQNFALQEVLREKGYHVETIRRSTYRDTGTKDIIIRFVKNIVKTAIGRQTDKHILNRKFRFYLFNRKYIHFSKCVLHDNNYPCDLNAMFDYFVVGSDQVWNAGFRIISDDILNHLAFFASGEKRIAYAASFGTDRIANGFEQYFIDELPRFKAISVREETGAKIVEECGANAEVVLDPTMLLGKENWMEFAKKPAYVKESSFIVTYFLGEKDKRILEYIKSIAGNTKVYNLDIESQLSELIDSVRVFSTAPDEFVWLIQNADCVLTDSFHATVLSILFHKPFCVFERKAIRESYKMGSRIDTLLGMFQLERFRNRDCLLSIRPEPYDAGMIDKIIDHERKKSLDFLRRALEE